MSDSVWAAPAASALPTRASRTRHTALVRITHWMTTIAFLPCLSAEWRLSSLTRASIGGKRATYSLRRCLSADSGLAGNRTDRLRLRAAGPERLEPVSALPSCLAAVLTGLLYEASALLNGHFRKNLAPQRADLSPRASRQTFAGIFGCGRRWKRMSGHITCCSGSPIYWSCSFCFRW